MRGCDLEWFPCESVASASSRTRSGYSTRLCCTKGETTEGGSEDEPDATTERSSTEHLAQLTDAFLLAKENMARWGYLADRDYGSTTSSFLGDIMDVLPITTLDAFAQKYQPPPEQPSWIRSRIEKMAWSSTSPPGKRFSLRQMRQILWRPEHYRWFKEGAGLRLFSDASGDDRTPQKGPRIWAQLAGLMWADKRKE